MEQTTDSVDEQDSSRRQFLLMLAGASVAGSAVMLTGCGGGGGGSSSSSGPLVPGPEFFPLGTGDTWQYETIDPPGSASRYYLKTRKVVGPMIFNGNNAVQVQGPVLFGSSDFAGAGVVNSASYYQTTASNLYYFGLRFRSANDPSIFFNPPEYLPWSLGVGEQVTTAITSTSSSSSRTENEQITRASDQNITTRAGTFRCLVYTVIKDEGYIIYLAKNIGIVRYVSPTYGQVDLTFATVNSQSIGTFKPDI